MAILKFANRLEISDWLLTDKVSSWPGSATDRGWRYLRQGLEKHDTAETDFKYSKAVLEALLSNNAGSPPPPWLIESLEVCFEPRLSPVF